MNWPIDCPTFVVDVVDEEVVVDVDVELEDVEVVVDL